MRILLACEFYFPSVGGVQEVVRQLAERLAERGHQITVATSHLPERDAAELNGVNIREFRVSGNLARGLTGEVEAYRNYVTEGTYDVFMVKAAQQWTFDALLPVLDRITKPKVFIPCGFSGLYEPVFADYFRGMPEALHKFNHLIFYASNYRDINLAREHGISSFTVIPNGASEREFGVSVDSSFRPRHNIPADAFVVLTVGSLTGQKGHRELAEAFELAAVGDRPAVLILNGNKPRPQPLSQAIEQLPGTLRYLYREGGIVRVLKWVIRTVLIKAGLGSLLTAFGYNVQLSLDALVARINRAAPSKRAMLVDLPRAELVQAYLNSDLFVFASNVEYSPLVLYEAAAAGLPFLSVPVGNAAEIAEWTGAGVICPASRDERGYTRVDPARLAEEIMRLAADPITLRHLGQTGRKRWAERFTWEKIADQYEAVFLRLHTETQHHDGKYPQIPAGRAAA